MFSGVDNMIARASPNLEYLLDLYLSGIKYGNQ